MSQEDSDSASVPRKRWTIALLLGFGVLVNYFDRVNLSVSRDALQASFGISAVMFGYLSSAYNWTYALLQLPSGLLLDRFGVRRVGIISTVIWSVASFAAAISTGVAGLFGARLLLGIGEAPTFPANAKAIGYWFPKNERSLATAMFDAAAKFSSAIGIPLLGLLMVYFGWRWNFAATGFISLVYFALFYAYYRNPSEDKLLTNAERDFIARGGAQPEDRAQAAKGAPLAYLLRQRQVWGLALGFAFLQLHFLSAFDLAAVLSFQFPACGLAAFSAVYQRALALCDVYRSSCGRLARGCLDSARLERRPSSPGGAHRRNSFRPGNFWRGQRAHSGRRTLLDQHVHRRTVCRFARGMVYPFADRSARKRRHGWRNSKFRQSTRRDCRAGCHRLHRASDAFFYVGVRGTDCIFARGYCGIYISSRTDGARP